MKVIIGADHGGFKLKNVLKKFLEEKGYDIKDEGPYELDPDDDYPDYGRKVAEKIGREAKGIGQKNAMGILVCRSAAGIIIAANKVRGVRGVAVVNETQARHSRKHNDANVLGLSGDWTPEEEAKKIAATWLETHYSNEERHTRRLKKIAAMEK